MAIHILQWPKWAGTAMKSCLLKFIFGIFPVDIVPVFFKAVKILFQGTKKDLKWEGFAHIGTFCP
jgi:hypothetical protein